MILFRASTSPGLSSGDALQVRFWMPTMDWVISMRTKFIPLPSSRPSRSFTHVNISPGWPVTIQTRLSPTLNNVVVGRICRRGSAMESLIARFMGRTWGPSGADRTQVGPMLAPWTLLSGVCWIEGTWLAETQRTEFFCYASFIVSYKIIYKQYSQSVTEPYIENKQNANKTQTSLTCISHACSHTDWATEDQA